MQRCVQLISTSVIVLLDQVISELGADTFIAAKQQLRNHTNTQLDYLALNNTIHPSKLVEYKSGDIDAICPIAMETMRADCLGKVNPLQLFENKNHIVHVIHVHQRDKMRFKPLYIIIRMYRYHKVSYGVTLHLRTLLRT